MRAFVYIRQYALTYRDLSEKLNQLESKYNQQFKDISEAINFLLNKEILDTEQKLRKKIGYK
jgi:TATA-binding protein-associated factor Taf7